MRYFFLWREYNPNGIILEEGWELCSSEQQVLSTIERFKETSFEKWIIKTDKNQMFTPDEFLSYTEID
jgi:hypothetical protein